MGAIPQLLLSKRTGESLLLIATGKLGSLFLRRADEHPRAHLYLGADVIEVAELFGGGRFRWLTIANP
jgi:hypothetical protein